MKAALKPGTVCEIVNMQTPMIRHNNGRFVTATAPAGEFLGMSAWYIDAEPALRCHCGCTQLRFVFDIHLRPISDPDVDLSVPDAVPTEQVTS